MTALEKQNPAPRTLIIGLDGATFDLIQPWSAAGYLPTLARLMREGAYGVLDAFPNTNSAAAWSSIVTGTNPAKHGIFDFGERTLYGETWHPITALDRQRDPFWRLLSAAGQRVGVMNVPISYPADPIQGFMVSGMDSPQLTSKGIAHPPSFLQEAQAQGIEYVLDLPNVKELRQREPNHMPAQVRAMVENRTQAFLYGMERYACDVGMVVFVATDRMQHYYWSDAADVNEDKSWTPLRELYQLLDSCIAKILTQAGEHSNVIVLSDHGFGRGRHLTEELPQILQGAGLLSFRQRSSPTKDLLGRTLQFGRRVLPESVQYQLALRFPQLRQRAQTALTYGHLNWAKTKVYPPRISSALRVNLAGREEFGTVPPEDYEQMCAEVCGLLEQLTDPVSGAPVVRETKLRDELYHGPFRDRASDIYIRWDYSKLGNGLSYRGAQGTIVAHNHAPPGNQWQGNHGPEGIFIAHGPQIRKGVTPKNPSQYDIVPTLLYLQRQPRVEDMDGRVLTEIIEPATLASYPPSSVPPTKLDAGAPAPRLEASERTAIEERLRGLGYIE